ncbi:hypothetical protein SLS62_001962 [Diatrype stigma]|uniref:Rhodopsin domain-containing protein n=1 Tax=Diatrype stigma TaxID=117547 RepID=A0AAN9YVK7_9PEZI
MSPIADDAARTLAVLWTLTAVTFLFVLLRLYTRVKVVHAYGIDDHFFNAAFVFLLVYDILITTSSHYGFGRDVAEIPSLRDEVTARLLADTGQSVLVVGMVLAKTSLAFFLRRIAATRRQRVAIWAPVLVLAVLTPVVVIVSNALATVWVSCTPIEAAWNPSIVGGTCNLDLQGGLAIVAGGWTVIVDLWYAAVPWYLLWKLQMPRREKILIGSCMSFGVLIVPLIVWHGAEISVTMITIGIAVCQPVYRPWLLRVSRARSSSNGRYEEIEAAKRGRNNNANNDIGRRSPNDDQFAMRTIGGTPLVRDVVAGNSNSDSSTAGIISDGDNMSALAPPSKYRGVVSHAGGSDREERQQLEEGVEAHPQWPLHR